MAVIHGEEGAGRPFHSRWLILGLDDVHDDRDSIFIVVSLNSLVSVRGIGTYHTMRLGGKLSLGKV